MTEYIEAAKKLYIYAFPLIVTEATHRRAKDKGFEHLREFPTEKEKRVVKLNMDTLYSFAWTQLANTPYAVHIPKITERYWLFPIMDAYTNVVASIGTRTPEQSDGDYLLILENDPLPKGYENYRPIRLKDSLNSILLRIETRGKVDYALVHSLQDSITVRPVYENMVESVEPSFGGTPSAFAEELSAEDYFTLFVRLAKTNPIRDEEYIRLFELFGYVRETGEFSFGSLSDELKRALEQGRAAALEVIRAGKRNTDYYIRKRGWNAITGGVGEYGRDYVQRALTAYGGWGANLTEDSAYLVCLADDNGETLSSEYSYRLHIAPDGYPHAAVFWSLTLYGEPSRYPVKNPIDRFSVNSYDVEEGRAVKNKDGSLDIYISREQPSGDRVSNWLPAPQDEENFTLTLRVYYPDEETRNGQWEPPAVTKE